MTFRQDSIQAAVFDIGGVFTYPHYDSVAAKLSNLGIEAPSETVAYRRAHHAGVRALSAVERPTREHNPDFWILYDQAYAAELGVADDQIEEFRIAVRVRWNWVHEENVSAFHRIHATGLPLAIVSNNDGSASEQMQDHGVCQVGPGPLPEVAAIVDSTLVGAAKPDPAIFSGAVEALGIAPKNIVYVGDTVHADVVGAANAGMQAIQLDPFDHHRDYDHTRMRDLDEMFDAITKSNSSGHHT